MRTWAAAVSETLPRRAARALQATRVGRGLAVADFDNDGISTWPFLP